MAPNRALVVVTGLLAGLAAACRSERPAVTTGSLFEEMADLEALARFPEPAFRTVQFSSYDRRSRVPGGPDWFANADGFGGEPIPNFEKVLREPRGQGPGEYVIADVAGPGAIVRLWTAGISGRVRVYVDDLSRPLYDGDAEPFFRRPYDHVADLGGVDRTRFESTVYQQDASYAPIPFAKRLSVVWTGKIEDIHFYHLMVRTYAAGTKVAPFRRDDPVRCKDAIDRVTRLLDDPDGAPAPASSKPTHPLEAVLAPGEKRTLLELAGPGALRGLTLRVTADDIDAALRQTILRVVCDGFARGQVQSPLGDFFGAAPGVNPYASLPFSVRADGRMTCRFIMPFERSLRVSVENFGGQPVRVDGEAAPMDFLWDDRAMHFRAGWRVDHDLVASGEDPQDLAFLLARGRGAYVGTTSLLMNPAAVPTEWGGWWGEGDEKVFVDDDAVPSIFGTGSEDYYDYSWSIPDIFFHPYCGQPRNDGPGNRGFVADYRWHILDRIPFARSIDFRMELNSHERTPGLSYARTSYYYARPGTLDDRRDIKPDDVRIPRLPEGWGPAARFGAKDAEFFQAEDVVADRANATMRNGALWAGGRLLVWTPSRPGETKRLRIRVREAGTYRIRVTAALTPRSGAFAARIDGLPAGSPAKPLRIDLRDPFRTMLRTFSFEPVGLTAGDHVVVVESEGTRAGDGGPEIGLDFVWLQKAGEGA